MKEINLMPQDQVGWYIKETSPQPLTSPIKTDVVIVGGGMAGLSAAQSFMDKGCSVVLLEKNFCGAGASGKSSGFITPDSELNLSSLTRQFGMEEAKKLWDFVLSGVQFIENNIKKLDIKCDYQIQDSLIVANSANAMSKIKTEFQAHKKEFHESVLHDKENMHKILGSNDYYGGMSYSKTFGIHTYHYCQGIKENLQARGVKVFEETPVIKLHSKGVDTVYATVQADHVVVCMDRFIPEIQPSFKDVYHAQNFLMFSAPLQEDEIRKIFPDKNYMVWDTDFLYQYYRMTGNRFMIGGSDFISVYWGKEQHNSRKMFEKLNNYTKKKFPNVKINFEYFWPGMIGVSKDIMPIADYDSNLPNVYYVSAAAGLPWAAALGSYSADKIINQRGDLDAHFSLKRKFPLGHGIQSILRKRITFALSNLITLFK